LPALASARAAVQLSAPTVAIGAVAAAVVVAVTLMAGRGVRAGSAGGAWRAVDLTVAAGVVVGGLAIARGAVTTRSVAGGTDPLLLALPVLAVVCGGLLVGRAWPVLTAAASRAFPSRFLAPRLGLLGAVRSPLRPVATAAFLAAATGIVAFAGTYQATLRQGAVDEATFAVPLDAIVRTGPSNRAPLAVASKQDYAAAGAEVHPVVRSAATVRINAAESLTPDVIGVDPDALALIGSWDQVVGAASPAEVRRLLAVGAGTEIVGAAVPAGSRTLAFAAAGNVADLDISAWLRRPDGRDLGLPLTFASGRLTADLPEPAAAGTVLFAFAISENEFALTRRLHRTGEGHDDAEALTGHLEFGAPPSGDWAGWGAEGATVSARGDTLAIDYGLTGSRLVVRAGADRPVAPLPVFADAGTAAAASGGTLSVSLNSGPPVTATVVGVLPRFPTARSAFVIADQRALATAMDIREPGTGSVSELWLAASGPGFTAALAGSPFDLLRVDFRQARQDRLAADPLATGAAGLLTGSALASFAVALVALVLLVIAERRDESAQLYVWESDGVAPRTLRLSLFLRAVAVVAVGVPGGVLIGLGLSQITTALVRVTAVGTDPVPPLNLAISPLWTLGLVGTGVAAGLAVCGGLAAVALRERLPRRPEEV
jgi:hypothetical protein